MRLSVRRGGQRQRGWFPAGAEFRARGDRRVRRRGPRRGVGPFRRSGRGQARGGSGGWGSDAGPPPSGGRFFGAAEPETESRREGGRKSSRRLSAAVRGSAAVGAVSRGHGTTVQVPDLEQDRACGAHEPHSCLAAQRVAALEPTPGLLGHFYSQPPTHFGFGVRVGLILPVFRCPLV